MKRYKQIKIYNQMFWDLQDDYERICCGGHVEFNRGPIESEYIRILFSELIRRK